MACSRPAALIGFSIFTLITVGLYFTVSASILGGSIGLALVIVGFIVGRSSDKK